jgi:hypothetical protein
MLYTIVTTIQKPTSCIRVLSNILNNQNASLIIIGDKKGPSTFDLNTFDDPRNFIFLPLESQYELGYSIARLVPENSYARKNIGYLIAISKGATCIYETDDDNAPLENWNKRNVILNKCIEVSKNNKGWVNIYKYFTNNLIWPRGFPLDEIHNQKIPVTESLSSNRYAPIQQGLVNGSADVDSIWRLIMNQEFIFDNNTSVYLPSGNWCPFNTQSTWWWPIAYPLLYIPSYCSFRMCDIWKSFVAQRCLWELGYGVAFHAPEVYQNRNPHDLMKDFNQEIIGYTHNKQIVQILESTTLQSGNENIKNNLYTCYQSLVKHGFFPSKELDLLEAWLEDLKIHSI